MLPMVLEDLFNYSFMLWIKLLEEDVPLGLPLHEGLGVVHQVNVHDIKVIQVVQIEVKDHMKLLLYLLS